MHTFCWLIEHPDVMGKNMKSRENKHVSLTLYKNLVMSNGKT